MNFCSDTTTHKFIRLVFPLLSGIGGGDKWGDIKNGQMDTPRVV